MFIYAPGIRVHVYTSVVIVAGQECFDPKVCNTTHRPPVHTSNGGIVVQGQLACSASTQSGDGQCGINTVGLPRVCSRALSGCSRCCRLLRSLFLLTCALRMTSSYSQAGSVLLTNKGNILPLKLSSTSKIALVGPNAGCALANETSCDASHALFGGYTGWPGDDKVFTFKDTATAKGTLPEGAELIYAEGCKTSGNSTSGFAAAVAAAKKADVVVAVVGDSGDLGWNHNTCGEDDDRTVLDLPGVQPELLQAILDGAPDTPVIAILVHGRPVCLTTLAHTLPTENLLEDAARLLSRSH